MRRIITFVAVAVVAASCAPTVNVEQEKSALLARDAEWSTTPSDIAKWATYLTPDATFAMGAAPEMKGAKAIQDALMPMSKAPGFKVTWKPTSAEVGGDIGYTHGTYEFTMNNTGGKPATEHGVYVTTWKKINGAWMVTHDMGTPDAPVAPLSPMVVTPAAKITWMDVPPFLPKGAKLAVLVGDPSKPEPFTVRLQMPDGYKIAPHTHPTTENITVIEGTFLVGMGSTVDRTKMMAVPRGGFASAPAQHPHYAEARGATIVQVHAIGPFALTYVNPADAPVAVRSQR